ncbi:MAG: carbamoyltransferase HypF [Pseudobutyrivibrio sp.]|nr:carbamoyltransferase HypF [Pseudobutyrivibrio sp.]
MIRKYTIKGLVQGIGYRPWVARLAEELNICGWVRNTGGIVTVMASGDEAQLDEMYRRLSCDVPTGGFVNSIDALEVDNSSEDFSTFKILESDEDTGENLPLIPADIATCDKCAKELMNPDNRRYRHPFISCTICGPRYSIIKKLPYDRDTITMGDFDMCPECHREYTAKNDRRRHAQTIACPECGPKLFFKVVSGPDIIEYDEIQSAATFIKQGGIVAIKDIGGYHLACDPHNENAVAQLRALKHREAKAFAVMFENIDQVREYCLVSEEEASLLEEPARPIVLVKRLSENARSFPQNVCLTSPSIGAMLPCNPVQIMLAQECGPLIMTSGNASGDVLETDNDCMIAWMTERANAPEMAGAGLAVLGHNRDILRPMDDSVMKIVHGRRQFVRRARGYVPNPISVDIDGEIFAGGGDLKSSFCYIKNGLAYVSQYLGDLESVSCQEFYTKEKEAMTRIFGFNPKQATVDMHPGYFSRVSVENSCKAIGLPVTEVQHHMAHVASVIAEYQLKGPVLGFAFDGTGYGNDGMIWGSETFLWNGHSMDRVAHLEPSRLIGGNEGAKNCKTILTGMLHSNGITPKEVTMESQLIMAAIDKNINVVKSTSMGRLFDAVASMLDICHYNSYEGQAPIELENVAATANEAYPLTIPENGETIHLFVDIMDALDKNVDKAAIARGFIYAVADYIVAVANKNKKHLDANNQIVLSGGTFLNTILLERTIDLLEDAGYNVYTAQQLPPGDGGICLGQAYLSRYIN